MKQINQPSIVSWILLFSLAIIWGVNFLFIKTQLINSRIMLDSNVNLEILLALSSYLIKDKCNNNLIDNDSRILLYKL